VRVVGAVGMSVRMVVGVGVGVAVGVVGGEPVVDAVPAVIEVVDRGGHPLGDDARRGRLAEQGAVERRAGERW
jgi:hypothetical protein